jgi:hypothetical protein
MYTYLLIYDNIFCDVRRRESESRVIARYQLSHSCGAMGGFMLSNAGHSSVHRSLTQSAHWTLWAQPVKAVMSRPYTKLTANNARNKMQNKRDEFMTPVHYTCTCFFINSVQYVHQSLKTISVPCPISEIITFHLTLA